MREHGWRKGARRQLGVAILSLGLLWPGVAAADFHIGAGAGVFRPWKGGDSGRTVSGHVMGSIGGQRFRVGGEFEVRSFQTTVGGLDGRYGGASPDVDYDTYFLRFVFQYHPWPKAVVSPYVGVGTGILITDADDTPDPTPGGDSDDDYRGKTGWGWGFLGLAGVEVPIPGTSHVSIFGEGRIGRATEFWIFRNGDTKLRTDELGGLTGMGGLRLRF